MRDRESCTVPGTKTYGPVLERSPDSSCLRRALD